MKIIKNNIYNTLLLLDVFNKIFKFKSIKNFLLMKFLIIYKLFQNKLK